MRLILLPLTIAGCSGHSQDSNVSVHYAERVEEALDLPIQAVGAPEDFPMRRDRRHAIEPVNVSLSAWHALEDCDAGGLIAGANNSLGRVRTPFERVRYSHALLLALEHCEDTMSAREWEQFQDARVRKSQQIDEERWNAFWGSEAVERSFSRTTPLEGSLRSEVPAHWKKLLAVVTAEGTGALSTEEWYSAAQALERSAALGEAIRFMVQTSWALERVSRAVKQSRTDRTNCLKRDRRVIALMRGHYVNQLQPLMAAGDQTIRTTAEVLESISERLTPSEGVPQGMAGWMKQWSSQSAFQRYRKATRDHASQIGVLLKACGESL